MSSIDTNIHVYAKLAGHDVMYEIMPNDNQPAPGHVAMLTNHMLVYKHRRVIPRIVSRRIESVAKMLKLSQRINLLISSDLGITNPRFILRF